MADDNGDEFNELQSADIDTVHTVGKAANGTTILFAKAAEDGAEGVFGADFVRDMIAKGGDDAGDTAPVPNEITVTLDGAEIAKAIHAAALRHAAGVRKADMSTKDVNDLPDSAFAHVEPGGTKDDNGKTVPRSKRHYPVHDATHARNALGRAAQQMNGDDADAKRIATAALPKIKAAAKKLGVDVAKSDFLDFSGGDLGDGSTAPGSPQWEGQDASAAHDLIGQILAVVPGVKSLAQREAAEVMSGAADDMADVCDLDQVCEHLMCAARMLGAFAVTETAEAGDLAKATPAPTDSAATATPTQEENAVSNADGTQNTTDAVAKSDAGGLTQEQLAEYGRQALIKKAAKKAAKLAAQASGAAQASDGARTIPGTETVQEPSQGPDDVTKAASGLASALDQVMAPVVKQLGELAAKVNAQDERVSKMAAQPDDRRSPLLNGAIGQPSLAMRGDGPTNTPEFQAVLKAVEDQFPEGPARDQAMKGVALAALKARFTPGS